MCIWKFILLFLLLPIMVKEGYQNNMPPPNYPDGTQFVACHDYTKVNYRDSELDLKGNNNYKLFDNSIGEPQEGVYSNFLNIYKLRNYDHFFHAPICENHYTFDTSIDTQYREIPDSTDEDINAIYSEEIELDNTSIKDPNFIYGNPQFIQNKITYSEDNIRLFLENHRSHDDENMMYRIDPDIYN